MVWIGEHGLETGPIILGRYHLDLASGRKTIKDRKGVEAFDLVEALTQARAVSAEMRAADKRLESGAWTLMVRSADGAILDRLTVE